MADASVLRTTKIGNGFVKEDVLGYLDELNTKITDLQKELEVAKGRSTPTDPQEIAKYRTQVDNLQEKLNASNNALRAAKKENDELKQQIETLKAGGTVPAAAGANNNQALEAAKREIDTLRNQLKAAEQKGGGAAANSQIQQALEAAKKEIDSLRAKLKTAEQQKGGNPAADAELNKTKQELTKANSDLKAKTAELTAKTSELAAKTKESADKDSKIAQLTKDAAAATDNAAKKDKEIADLNAKVEELKDAANNPALMMNSLFVEAQKTVNKLKQEAKDEAEATVKEAKENADKLVKDADEKAKKTVSDADAQAEKTISDAYAQAEKTISDANSKAKNTIDEANNNAEKVNIMTSKVRDTLLSEIESVNAKFTDLTDSLTKLTGQASEHMIKAQNIISDAKKAVDTGDDALIKKAEAPKDETAKKETKADTKKEDTKKNDDPFASVGNSGYNAGNLRKEDRKPMTTTFTKPAAPEPVKTEEPKPAPKKASFNFDMSELLKAAEEEAAKGSQD